MYSTRTRKKALAASNCGLFEPENLTPPTPATLYTLIREQAQRVTIAKIPEIEKSEPGDIPDTAELYRMYNRFNWLYFDGKLPTVKIEYSNRMSSAGSYNPDRKLIKIGVKYHQIFPGEIWDTLKHEMIHIVHFYHNRAFKAVAKRIGASVRAKNHPSLRRKPRYVYICKNCGTEYPRRKRLRMASCGKCSPNGKYDERFKLKLLKSYREK